MKKNAFYKFKFGFICIGYDNNTVISIDKVSSVNSKNEKTEFTNNVFAQIKEYFLGSRKAFDFKYKLFGTDFQKSVWKALEQIPYGQTRSYKDIAIAIGNPKASRAVGMANNKNPISIVVPCHRVIGSNGKLVGYANGLEMKEYLLKLEKNNSQNLT